MRWDCSPVGWLKCNTDGASKGNLEPSSAAFSIRDQDGNILVAEGVKTVESNNLVAEARAIREGLVYCAKKGLSNVIF